MFLGSADDLIYIEIEEKRKTPKTSEQWLQTLKGGETLPVIVTRTTNIYELPAPTKVGGLKGTEAILKDLSPTERLSALFRAGYISETEYDKQLPLALKQEAQTAKTQPLAKAGIFGSIGQSDMLMYSIAGFLAWRLMKK